jgi:hypothetical protein
MAEKIELPGKVYLGDSVYVESVYVEVDRNGSYVLTTENGLPDDPSNRIYLEPEVYERLVKYVEIVKAAILKWRETKREPDIRDAATRAHREMDEREAGG